MTGLLSGPPSGGARGGGLTMRDVLIAVVLVVAEFGAVQATQADVLCIRRSGAVVLRTPACRRKEVRMDVAALGLQGPPGSKGAQGNEFVMFCLLRQVAVTGGVTLASHGRMTGARAGFLARRPCRGG